MLDNDRLSLEKLESELHKLNELYEKSFEMGNYENALRYALSILEIEKIIFPSEHEDIAASHINIGKIYNFLNQDENALRHFKLALDITESLLPGHPYIADLNNIIGILYGNLGRHEEALQHHKLVLDIRENSSPPEPLVIATSHDIIGNTYNMCGRYEDALRHHKFALDIMQSSLLPEHLTDEHLAAVIALHNNIGMVYTNLGQYEDALWHHELALEMLENFLPPEAPYIASSHNNIGTVHNELDQYEDALRHYKLALDILENSLPPEPLDIVMLHSNIGLVYNELGQYENALRYHKLALDIAIENALPPQNVAMFHSHIGNAYRGLGQYENALWHHKLALDIMPEHPSIAMLHTNIGVIYGELGQYENALSHLERALEIRKNSLLPEHLDIAHSYKNLIVVCYDQGDNKEATKNAIVLTELLPAIYQNIMSTYSENIRTNLLHSMSDVLSVLNTVAYTNPGQFDTKILYGLLLCTKDISAEAEFVIRASVLPELYPEYADGLIKLKEKQQNRDHLMLNDTVQKEEIESLSKEIRDIEIQLFPYVKELNFKRHMAVMTAETVLEKLPQNHVLLEYGWYYYRKSAADARTDITSGGRYYAYLLRDGEITLWYLDLDEQLIHKKLDDVRLKITEKSDTEGELRELYQMLISPFAELLHDIEHLYIAPDGELYKLPFELLLDEDNCALSDKFAVSYLSSGRDLARPERWNKPVQDYANAAILADPLYDLPDGAGPETASGDDDTGKTRGIRSRQSRDWDKQARFPQLPFGRVEADALDRVFSGKKDLRYQLNAKKSVLSEICSRDYSPEIIHISTHGFALERQEVAEDQLTMPLEGWLTHGISEDPLIRSGLAFSGANTWLKSDRKKPLKEYGDGILNAKEALSLELHGTDLLVLSACQTALGETKNGEGIKGLRRSFELAGVRSILCTLWSVSDNASAILMEKFYINLLNNGMDKLQALTNAKEYVKNMTNNQEINYYREIGSNYEKKGFKDKAKEFEDKAIHKEKSIFKDDSEKKPFKHPYFWAGYILQGDVSRPLT